VLLCTLCDVTTKERIRGTRAGGLPLCGRRALDIWCAPIRWRAASRRA
jgi:hypothetical protein